MILAPIVAALATLLAAHALLIGVAMPHRRVIDARRASVAAALVLVRLAVYVLACCWGRSPGYAPGRTASRSCCG